MFRKQTSLAGTVLDSPFWTMRLYMVIHGVALVILQDIFFIEHRVEARNGDIIPLGSMFGSVERRHLKNSRLRSEATSYENEKVEYPQYRRRKSKNKHKTITHKNTINFKQHSKVNQEHKKKIKKRPKIFDNKRFIKTTLRENDSKMSGSIESDVKRKPVDIIVHIKMND